MEESVVKQFYRDIEELLNHVDGSLGDEAMLRAVVHTLVTDASENTASRAAASTWSAAIPSC